MRPTVAFYSRRKRTGAIMKRREHRLQRRWCWVVLLMVIAQGCASFSSTPISRFDDNSFVGDSNGRVKIWDRARPFKGTPVKLKVQTHTDIFIDETYYLKLEGGRWTELSIGTKLYSVRQKEVMTDQIVMVDFKRPASGTLDLTLEYNDAHYLKSVNSKLEDNTLEDSANLVGTIVKSFSTPTSAENVAAAKSVKPSIIPVTRTVAYQRFDINAADYEQQMECFVNQHLNNCNVCGITPSYDRATDGFNTADPILNR